MWVSTEKNAGGFTRLPARKRKTKHSGLIHVNAET